MASKELGIILEYEELLCGKRKNFSAGYVGKSLNPVNTIELFRYVYEDLLGWEPEQVVLYTDKALLKKLKLDILFKKLPFPLGLDPMVDFYYIGHLLYPHIFAYDHKSSVLRTYDKVLSREMSKFPKGFFDGADGRLALALCVRSAISSNLKITSIEEVYRYFAIKSRALFFLKKQKLFVPCVEHYADPLSMIHDILKEEDKSELYYRYYSFLSELSEMKDKNKKKKRRKKDEY